MIPSILLRFAVATVVVMLDAVALRAGDDVAAIEQRLRQWTDAFNADQVEAVCDLFAPNLIANYRGQPEKNFDTLCSGLQRALTTSQRDHRYALELNEIMVSGDMAVVRLIWHLTVTDKETGEMMTSSDRGIDVFRRQPDGQWRIVRYIAYEME
ncbi:MAG: SgcJ/EcaC family oxidoreductase [Methyloceanibacter sp.]|nr:SgcJ/EcaC family oxidoreductase [Methyloceanibacter sp.]